MRLVGLLLLCTVVAHAGEGDDVLRALSRKQRTLASLVDADTGVLVGEERDDAPPTLKHVCGDALARTLPGLEHALVAELRRADYHKGNPGQEDEPTVSCDAHACSVWIDGAATSRMLYFSSTPAGLRLRGFSVELYMPSSPKRQRGKRVEQAVAKMPRCP